MTYRHIIFDFDGTLADTFPWFISVMDEVADRFHLERLPRDEVDALRGRDARDLLESRKIPLWKIPLIARYLKSLMARDVGAIRLFDGTREMLQTLADRGTRLTVTTSNSRENVLAVLGKEVSALFHGFECGVTLFGKGAKYRRILRNSPYPAAETLCIGDELRDLSAAREVHIPFGAVGWGFTHGSALQEKGPEHYFGQVSDIAELVCAQQGLRS